MLSDEAKERIEEMSISEMRERFDELEEKSDLTEDEEEEMDELEDRLAVYEGEGEDEVDEDEADKDI